MPLPHTSQQCTISPLSFASFKQTSVDPHKILIEKIGGCYWAKVWNGKTFTGCHINIGMAKRGHLEAKMYSDKKKCFPQILIRFISLHSKLRPNYPLPQIPKNCTGHETKSGKTPRCGKVREGQKSICSPGSNWDNCQKPQV